MEALKFREMPYERPDGEALKTSMRTLTENARFLMYYFGAGKESYLIPIFQNGFKLL